MVGDVAMMTRDNISIERFFLYTPLTVQSLTNTLNTQHSPVNNPQLQLLRTQGMRIAYQFKTSQGFAYVNTVNHSEPDMLHANIQQELKLNPQSTITTYASESSLRDIRSLTKQLSDCNIGWYVLATVKKPACVFLEHEFVLGVQPPKRFAYEKAWRSRTPELFRKPE